MQVKKEHGPRNGLWACVASAASGSSLLECSQCASLAGSASCEKRVCSVSHSWKMVFRTTLSLICITFVS